MHTGVPAGAAVATGASAVQGGTVRRTAASVAERAVAARGVGRSGRLSRRQRRPSLQPSVRSSVSVDVLTAVAAHARCRACRPRSSRIGPRPVSDCAAANAPATRGVVDARSALRRATARRCAVAAREAASRRSVTRARRLPRGVAPRVGVERAAGSLRSGTRASRGRASASSVDVGRARSWPQPWRRLAGRRACSSPRGRSRPTVSSRRGQTSASPSAPARRAAATCGASIGGRGVASSAGVTERHARAHLARRERHRAAGRAASGHGREATVTVEADGGRIAAAARGRSERESADATLAALHLAAALCATRGSCSVVCVALRAAAPEADDLDLCRATPRSIWSRAISDVVEMPCTFSLNSSWFGRVAQRVVVADDALLVVAEDRLVERLHPVLRRARRRWRRGSSASCPCPGCSRG